MIDKPIKLNDLYQEVILDHNRNPRNFKKLENATSETHGVNPLCGDSFQLYLKLSPAGTIDDVGFQGSGCAISKSSASMMAQIIQGKKISEAQELENAFIKMLTDKVLSADERLMIGRLKIFEGVKEFPIRVKCATLI